MRLYIVILLCTFTIISCHDDNIQEVITEETSDPINSASAFITGTTNTIDGSLLANVQVEVYQDEELRGSTQSDLNGIYSTATIALDPEKKVTISYFKEEFDTKFRRFELIEGQEIEKNVSLGRSMEVDSLIIDPSDLNSSLDTNNIILSGYAILANGIPVEGVLCRAIWDYTITGGHHFTITGSSQDYTDSDGYYEVSVPKNEGIRFNAFHTRYPEVSSNRCTVNFTPDFEIAPDPLSQSQSMIYYDGFQADTEIVLRENVVFETLKIAISGKVLSCDGAPLQSGSIRLTVNQILSNFIVGTTIDEYDFGPNGEFEINLETCDFEGDNDLHVYVYVENEDGLSSGEKEFDFSENADIGDVQLCYDLTIYPAELDLTYNNTNVVFEGGSDWVPSGFNTLKTGFTLAEGDHRTSCYWAAENIELGQNPLLWFKLRKGIANGNITETYETTIDEDEPQDLIMNITEIDGNWKEGTITGTVNSIYGIIPVNASFRIWDK